MCMNLAGRLLDWVDLLDAVQVARDGLIRLDFAWLLLGRRSAKVGRRSVDNGQFEF